MQFHDYVMENDFRIEFLSKRKSLRCACACVSFIFFSVHEILRRQIVTLFRLQMQISYRISEHEHHAMCVIFIIAYGPSHQHMHFDSLDLIFF